jgi:hypothetical protein
VSHINECSAYMQCLSAGVCTPSAYVLLAYVHDSDPACVLQDYLAQAQSGGEMGRSAGVPFNFVFYLREDILGAEEGKESSGAASAADGMLLY